MRSFYLPLAAGHQAHVCRVVDVVDALEVGRHNHHPYTGFANEVEYNLNSNLLADSFSIQYQLFRGGSPRPLFFITCHFVYFFR